MGHSRKEPWYLNMQMKAMPAPIPFRTTRSSKADQTIICWSSTAMQRSSMNFTLYKSRQTHRGPPVPARFLTCPVTRSGHLDGLQRMQPDLLFSPVLPGMMKSIAGRLIMHCDLRPRLPVVHISGLPVTMRRPLQIQPTPRWVRDSGSNRRSILQDTRTRHKLCWKP